MDPRAWLVCCCCLAAVGCASRRPCPSATLPATRAVASRPAIDPKALLKLDEIQPVPRLAVSTRPTTRAAPLEAVQLYAQARAAELAGDRVRAIALLERAITLDPESFELYYALGTIHRATGGTGSQALWALSRAAAIDPDHVEVHAQLGQIHLARGNAAKAVEHLRLALQTSDLEQQPDKAALVDLLLARSLQQQGYLRAAIERYQALLRRISSPRPWMRGSPELTFLATRPQVVLLQIAEMQERIGELEQALETYQAVAAREADSLELQDRICRLLLALGRSEEAIAVSVAAVSRFRASEDALELMRRTYRHLGREAQMLDELRRLHRQRSDDRNILFALAQALRSSGQASEALGLLARAWERSGADIQITRRLFDAYLEDRNLTAAAALLVESSAMRPDATGELASLWTALLRPSAAGRLRLPALQQLKVSPGAQAAKLFWVWRIADLQDRPTLARSSLEQAMAVEGPPYRPAWRSMLSVVLNRQEDEDAARVEAESLIARARRRGDEALAEELRGTLLLYRKQWSDAADALARAMALGNRSPDVQVAHVAALLEQGQETRAEQMLWKLVGEWPSFDQAYRTLLQLYQRNGQPRQASKVLQTWLASNPQGIEARLHQVIALIEENQFAAAEQVLLAMLADEPQDPQVLDVLEAFYTRAGRTGQYILRLEEQRRRHPDNRGVVQRLVAAYLAEDRRDDARRIVDDARKAAAADADVLYSLAHLYDLLDQRPQTEATLEEVLRLDATHAAACNDLGYLWADQGRNLDRAEEMIRIAVKAEPDNAAFLDSLGWVLYKRGRFADALPYLEASVKETRRPDPVVLDHLGDVLYRLGRAAEAAQRWKQAMDRMPDADVDDLREDLQKLRLELIQKLQSHEEGRPVRVAPVGEGVLPPAQASN